MTIIARIKKALGWDPPHASHANETCGVRQRVAIEDKALAEVQRRYDAIMQKLATLEKLEPRSEHRT